MSADPFAPTPLEQELVAERASTLRVAFLALERALGELGDAERALAAGADAAVAARRDELFAEAAERLWSLLVQREALGLFHHQDVLDVLRVPPAVHLAMGPRRSGR